MYVWVWVRHYKYMCWKRRAGRAQAVASFMATYPNPLQNHKTLIQVTTLAFMNPPMNVKMLFVTLIYAKVVHSVR